MVAVAPETVNVLQLGPALNVRGGVSSVERLIVEHVGDAGAQVCIRHIATMEDGPVWRKLLVFARSVRELRKALRTTEAIVHIHFSSRGSTLRKTILAWITVRAGRPLILHAHGASFDKFFDGLPGWTQQLLRSTFRRADCFLTLSTQWRDFFTRQCRLPEDRIVVLYNPTAVPAQVPVRAHRERVQFLFLGRIGRRKGAYDLLDAYAAMPSAVRARARLVFAGDGEVDLLRQRAAQFGDGVQVHAWIDSSTRDRLLAESDVFVLPSYREGLPMALLEALAHGLPVITTPVGGITDVITDEKEGLIVAPGDSRALCAAMCEMTRNETRRLSMGRAARASGERFDVGCYASELVRIYQRLLAEKRARVSRRS